MGYPQMPYPSYANMHMMQAPPPMMMGVQMPMMQQMMHPTMEAAVIKAPAGKPKDI